MQVMRKVQTGADQIKSIERNYVEGKQIGLLTHGVVSRAIRMVEASKRRKQVIYRYLDRQRFGSFHAAPSVRSAKHIRHMEPRASGMEGSPQIVFDL
jgi:hypothetical protein